MACKRSSNHWSEDLRSCRRHSDNSTFPDARLQDMVKSLESFLSEERRLRSCDMDTLQQLREEMHLLKKHGEVSDTEIWKSQEENRHLRENSKHHPSTIVVPISGCSDSAATCEVDNEAFIRHHFAPTRRHAQVGLPTGVMPRSFVAPPQQQQRRSSSIGSAR